MVTAHKSGRFRIEDTLMAQGRDPAPVEETRSVEGALLLGAVLLSTVSIPPSGCQLPAALAYTSHSPRSEMPLLSGTPASTTGRPSVVPAPQISL